MLLNVCNSERCSVPEFQDQLTEGTHFCVFLEVSEGQFKKFILFEGELYSTTIKCSKINNSFEYFQPDQFELIFLWKIFVLPILFLHSQFKTVCILVFFKSLNMFSFLFKRDVWVFLDIQKITKISKVCQSFSE